MTSCLGIRASRWPAAICRKLERYSFFEKKERSNFSPLPPFSFFLSKGKLKFGLLLLLQRGLEGIFSPSFSWRFGDGARFSAFIPPSISGPFFPFSDPPPPPAYPPLRILKNPHFQVWICTFNLSCLSRETGRGKRPNFQIGISSFYFWGCFEKEGKNWK